MRKTVINEEMVEDLAERAAIFLIGYKKTPNPNNNSKYRYSIAKLAYASIYFTNPSTGNNYTLREFAKKIGMTYYHKLYRWVNQFLRTQFTRTKYEVAIPSAADNTLIDMYSNSKIFWPSLYGYNKELNSLLERNLAAYENELIYRGLDIILDNH